MRPILTIVVLYLVVHYQPIWASVADSSLQNLPSDTIQRPLRCLEDTATRNIPLTITTEPSGAVVIIDDSTIGLSPVSVELNEGKHQLVLKKKGCYLKKAELSLDSTSMSELHFILQQPGSLLVKSDPVGAVIYINDKENGLTPVELNQLKPGNYQIKVKLKNYEPVEQIYEVKSAASDTLVITLKHTSAYQDSIAAIENRKHRAQRKLHAGIVGGVFLFFSLILLVMEVKE